ncbi:HCP-like protein [Lentinula guzmanii]|uniref:HCP-like protein n=1 Tax=Lentinula guzmanii TaxID=2804957 RepID=A0AA38JCX8_9AGAR|nr:HCP-like protein [Lentinula guzmanii]
MSSFSIPPPPPPPPPPSGIQFFSSSNAGTNPGLPPPPLLVTPDGGSAPHLEDPLAAPIPQKVDPDIPANMARNLDEQLRGRYNNNNGGYNPGGFSIPHTSRSPQPPGGGQQQWSAWSPALPTPPHPSLSPAPTLPYPNPNPNSNLGYNPPESYYSPVHQAHRAVSPSPTISQHITHPTNTHEPTSTSLTAPLPTIPALQSAMSTIQLPKHDPALKVAWARDVMFLVERAHAMATNSPMGDPPNGPVEIHDGALLKLAQVAVPMILDIASTFSTTTTPTAPHVSEALFHRASLLASGSFPEFAQRNPRQAFRDYESAARAGYGQAWFRIGRDYESFGDLVHAKECFQRGVRLGVGACLYRMAMAQLLGQLGFSVDVDGGLGVLKKAAVGSTVETPQPAYVYALVLLGEFGQIKVPEDVFFRLGLVSSEYAHMGSQGLLLEAKTHLTHSAYLHFSPAQYKLGHAYEFATPPFEFDALLSVEWYSRASQQGETEADMALSKWFLCGSRVGGPAGANTDPSLGGFDKDEQLAKIFAEKAARKGLPSAEFAMGYYCEVGIGGGKDLEEAKGWYQKAQIHGNTDAIDRLAALEKPSPQMLSREEHDTITESKLVRTRTQAKQRSEAQKVRDGYLAGQGQQVNQNQGGQQQGSLQQQPPGYPGPGGPVLGGFGGGMPPPGGQGAQGGRGNRRDSRPVVELIRKNTLGSYQQQPQGGHGRYHTDQGPGPTYPGQPAHASTLPPQGTHGQGPQGMRVGPGGGSVGVGPGGVGPGVGLRPEAARQQSQSQSQSYPNANRYTLVDPGSGSAPPRTEGVGNVNNAQRPDSRSPSRAGGGGGRPPPRRGPSGGVQVSGGVSGAGAGTGSRPESPATGLGVGVQPAPGALGAQKSAGPQTFAEMGITGAKAEDEKCVIM